MMNKYFLYHRFLITILLSFILVACQSTPEVSKKFNPYDFAKEQKELISDTADLGPKVNSKSDELVKTNRRVFIDENIVTDYTKIIDKNFTSTFPISVNFDNVDIRTVMETFSIVTGKNILVGDEVQGSVKARIFNEDWDDVLEAILEIKNIALTLNKDTNIVRVHTKEVISAQEEYKIKRKAEVRKTMDLNKSLEPVRSEIFKSFGGLCKKFFLTCESLNIPHKSSTADFLKLFILMQGACGTDKTRLKISESDFTYYGVYSF